ncbi:MFS transporter [Gordonia sp. TBRC 11910]|uniref:MFS transporter n=2 Tax=Gordonia asplenii TaxID=2725283 RepID=A0A848L8M9_9ACTN|nr:MFS transporter [Gordonia asplenii]
MSASGTTASPFRQPKAVWAVAFACVISFMGIGLVDPILPALAEGLKASPSDVSLLFTSYLVVTAVAMLGVNWVSSRIGSKQTLVVGLALIVVFAAGAGLMNSIAGVIGFRAGWGLGNALFIATSLAAIVASAKGGFTGAIILYEAALGVGIAVGPLLGGFLGSISWRGPFFGVAVLMLIALIATVAFVPRTAKPTEKIPLSAPLSALRHRGLLIMGIVALLYNWGFFTMMGYAPYPMKLSATQLGLVFGAWGVLVAAFAVYFAPRLQRRFGTGRVLLVNLLCLALVMAAIAIGIDTPDVVIVAVIVSGAFIGINNTLTTQAVMMVSPVDRSVASSAYGFLRFIGGGLAPFVAGKLAAATTESMAFALGAAAFVIAVPVLAMGRKYLAAAEQEVQEPEPVPTTVEKVAGALPEGVRPMVVAIGANDHRRWIVDKAAQLARLESIPLEIIHVRETQIVGDQAVARETAESAHALVSEELDRIAKTTDLQARGMVLYSVGDREEVGRVLARHIDRVNARAVAIRRSPGGVATVRGLLDEHGETSYNIVLLDPGLADIPLV